MDTPGFNDTHKSETEVLGDIASWLRETYEGDTRLNGIVYLHSLVNVRMEGSALRNLKMFRQLCGKDPLKNVILATSFWSKVAQKDALKREEQLKTTPEFWGEMLDRGSTMKRLIDPNSALEIVALLTKKPRITLQIQQELVEDRKSLVDTAAGQTVNEELVRLEQKHRDDLERIKLEMQEAMEERDQEMQQILQQQERRLGREFDKVRQEQDQLRYDRRAERRNLESFRAEIEQKAKQDREAMLQQMDFDQAVALVRANEGKIPVLEREALERKIAELSKELADKSAETKGSDESDETDEPAARKKKGSSRYLFKALSFVLPVTTMALLGVPIFSPFGNGTGSGGLIEKMLGGTNDQNAAA